MLSLSRVLQARKQNPKAFVFASRGKAKIQQARTAEKEQRRMHCEWELAGWLVLGSGGWVVRQGCAASEQRRTSKAVA